MIWTDPPDPPEPPVFSPRGCRPVREPAHVPAGRNEPVGYVRCLPSGAVHPAGYDCKTRR